jgi:hypothetical protein
MTSVVDVAVAVRWVALLAEEAYGDVDTAESCIVDMLREVMRDKRGEITRLRGES